MKRLDLDHARADMSHGAGGRAMAQLVDEIFVAALDNPMLAKRNDQALFEVSAGRMAGTGFETSIESDSAPLHGLVASMIEVALDLHVLRDPTRGELSATLNEIAAASNVGMILHEETIPMREEVIGACELVGIDPLHLANEGKLVCICDAAGWSA